MKKWFPKSGVTIASPACKACSTLYYLSSGLSVVTIIHTFLLSATPLKPFARIWLYLHTSFLRRQRCALHKGTNLIGFAKYTTFFILLLFQETLCTQCRSYPKEGSCCSSQRINDKVEWIQNATAKVIATNRKCDRTVLHKLFFCPILHWNRVKSCINHKI